MLKVPVGRRVVVRAAGPAVQPCFLPAGSRRGPLSLALSPPPPAFPMHEVFPMQKAAASPACCLPVVASVHGYGTLTLLASTSSCCLTCSSFPSRLFRPVDYGGLVIPHRQGGGQWSVHGQQGEQGPCRACQEQPQQVEGGGSAHGERRPNPSFIQVNSKGWSKEVAGGTVLLLHPLVDAVVQLDDRWLWKGVAFRGLPRVQRFPLIAVPEVCIVQLFNRLVFDHSLRSWLWDASVANPRTSVF